MMIRCYSELSSIDTFEERFRYLVLHGDLGVATFGFDRWINQKFYRSSQWRRVRNDIIVRDSGCDLGIEGYDIHHSLRIHHMNPLKPQDIIDGSYDIIDPEYLITTSHNTHNAIHFGDERQLPKKFVPRSRGDTKLW